jgi:superfamily I DNA and/or RNA helicase
MGVNRDMLSKTRVVAATLAATEFPCLDDFIFPIIVLDEACQMTEPSAGMSMRS